MRFKIIFSILAFFLIRISFAQDAVSLEQMLYKAITKPDRIVGKENSFNTEILLKKRKDYEINPITLIEMFPDLKSYLKEDSTFEIKNTFYLKGKINDDLAGFGDTQFGIRNINFKNLTINLNLYSKEVDSEIFASSLFNFEKLKVDSLRIESSNAVLIFGNCKIEHFISFYPSVESPALRIHNSKLEELNINNTQIGFFFLQGNEIRNLKLQENMMKQIVMVENIFDLRYDSLFTAKYIPYSRYEKRKNDSTTFFRDVIDRYPQFEMLGFTTYVSFIAIENNKFLSEDGFDYAQMAINAERMIFNDNQVECLIEFSPTITGNLRMNNNEFNKITFPYFSIPETPQNLVDIDWHSIDSKIVYTDYRKYFYKAENDYELADVATFRKYLNSFQKFYNVYKSNGNVEDANEVLLRIKELHLRRYKHLYKTEGGTTNFFRLKLNQLLSAYTRHGTDPAQAMTASMYIILLFAAIYFFYPSEWDTTTKKVMMQSFKEIFTSRRSNKLRESFRLLGAFFLSVLNAVTLSINAFITLGFGNIPTKGAAKYICIFQGFLGWFLLSIFIVSLINQVMM